MSIKLHGHPQLAEYTDPSQYPDISCQSNWVHGEDPRGAPVPTPPGPVLDLPGGTFGNGLLGHTHNDLIGYPLYGEISEPFRCRFAIKMFQVTGEAFVNPKDLDGIRDIIWDATNSSTPPPMIGDPKGEVIFKGSLVVDPNLAIQFPTKHGWWTPNWNVTTRYANGDVVEQLIYAPIWVILDPNVPPSDGIPYVSARVSPHSTLHPEENFGNNQVELLRGKVQYLPVAPLSGPYTLTFATSGYGADGLPEATTEVRKGADIHHFKPGVVLFDMTQLKNHQFDYTFDPAVLGAGKWSIIVGRRQVTLSNDELIVTQLVFSVTVPGGSTPTPPPPPMIMGTLKAGDTEVHGMGTSSAIAEVFINDVSAGQAPIDGSGNFERTVDPLIAGQRVTATQTVAGLTSARSTAVTVEAGPEPPHDEKWEVVSTIVKRLKVPGGLDRFCLCVADESVVPFACVELVVKPDPETH